MKVGIVLPAAKLKAASQGRQQGRGLLLRSRQRGGSNAWSCLLPELHQKRACKRCLCCSSRVDAIDHRSPWCCSCAMSDAVDLTLSDDEGDFVAPRASAGGAASASGGGKGEIGRQTTLTGLAGSAGAAQLGLCRQSNNIQRAVDTKNELRDANSKLRRVRRDLQALRTQEEELAQQVRRLEDNLRDVEEIALAEKNQSANDWECGRFPWDTRVDSVLKECFGLRAFRQLRDGQTQRSIINATLQKHDVLVLMATGSGKSLTYQLPGLCEDPGITLVVSPLKSLMHDQCLGLSELGVTAETITAETDKQTAKDILNRVAALSHPRPWFLYVTPERIAKSKTLMAKLQKAYDSNNLRRIVCDECHCVAMDGMDFRPDYLKLAILRNAFPTVPLLGCTATATQRVLDTVAKNLKLKGAVRFSEYRALRLCFIRSKSGCE